MVIKGFVILDDAGVVGIVPAAQINDAAFLMAMEYIRKHKVLQTVVADPEEDPLDLTLRLQGYVKAWQKNLEKSKN